MEDVGGELGMHTGSTRGSLGLFKIEGYECATVGVGDGFVDGGER